MPLFVDARVPLRFGSVQDAAAGSALLIEGDASFPLGLPAAHFAPAGPAGLHPPGCPCCAPRSPAADALGHLFLARARGELDFFRGVVAVCSTPEGDASVRAALESDPLVSAWFRLIP